MSKTLPSKGLDLLSILFIITTYSTLEHLGLIISSHK